MIGADLECLGLPHHQPNLSGFFMLQELHVPTAPLLPLIPLLVEPIQLRLPATAAEEPIEIAPQKPRFSRNREKRREGLGRYRSRRESSSSSPVVTATSSRRTMGDTWAPVSSSSGRSTSVLAMEGKRELPME